MTAVSLRDTGHQPRTRKTTNRGISAARPPERSAEAFWPERLDSRTRALVQDMRWMEFFEREPEQIGPFVQQRLHALITHVRESSPWWRAHLNGLGEDLAFADVQLVDGAAYRPSIASVRGPSLPCAHSHGLDRGLAEFRRNQETPNPLIAHLGESSAALRSHTDGKPDRGAVFADIPGLDRLAFRAALEHAGGPLPLPPSHGVPFRKRTSGSRHTR
jgi:hypothetical protein